MFKVRIYGLAELTTAQVEDRMNGEVHSGWRLKETHLHQGDYSLVAVFELHE
jgi:hypothetical protein